MPQQMTKANKPARASKAQPHSREGRDSPLSPRHRPRPHIQTASARRRGFKTTHWTDGCAVKLALFDGPVQSAFTLTGIRLNSAENGRGSAKSASELPQKTLRVNEQALIWFCWMDPSIASIAVKMHSACTCATRTERSPELRCKHPPTHVRLHRLDNWKTTLEWSKVSMSTRARPRLKKLLLDGCPRACLLSAEGFLLQANTPASFGQGSNTCAVSAIASSPAKRAQTTTQHSSAAPTDPHSHVAFVRRTVFRRTCCCRLTQDVPPSQPVAETRGRRLRDQAPGSVSWLAV